MLKYFFITVLIFIIESCNNKRPHDNKAIRIVEQCIEAHGGNNYRDLNVFFDYRNFRVHLQQHAGKG